MRGAEQVATAKLTTLFTAGLVLQVIILDPKAVFGGALRELGEADISTGEEIVVGLGFGGLLPREGAVRLAVHDG